MKRRLSGSHIGLAGCFVLAAWLPCGSFAGVIESPRDIPVVYSVDVVVVGGSCGAASAAAAAAEAGARVFLLAPRPYLGDDLCETRRLWLEPDETPASPLARRLFLPPPEPASAGAAAPAARDPNALGFEYEASLPSASRHKDTTPPSRLKDGAWAKPETDSVEYGGDVSITADLGAAQVLKEARLTLFHRSSADFNTESVAVATSTDKSAWRQAAVLKCTETIDGPFTVSTPVTGAVRFVRFDVKRGDASSRVLLGEIELIKVDGSVAAAARPPEAAGAGPGTRRLIKPLHIKRTLDETLLEAKVDFLFSCFPTELLRDGAGRPCGVVMANRAGRQAVLAKVIIDATPRAVVARMAGAQFSPYPAGEQVFRRIVMGGEPQSGPNFSSRRLGLAFKTVGGKNAPPSGQAELIEYTLRLPMGDGGFVAFAEADQRSRDLMWHPGQLDIAETLFQVPPDAVRGVKSGAGVWAGVAALELDAFRPAGAPGLYVLGGCADLPRPAAERLLRPLALLEMGTRLGQAAATEAKEVGPAQSPRVAEAVIPADAPGVDAAGGEVKETLTGVRPSQRGLATVPSPRRKLPVLGRYDVVVVGGGTGGAPAGIGASRAGAKTLLIEYLNGMGGVGTQGRIITYYHGYRGGFTAQVDAGIRELGATNYVAGKTEWWRQANRKAGTEVWFGVLGCGALVEDGLVKGVVVATPLGRGVVLAKTVIDASGNADIAAAAGAECDYTAGEDVGVQGAGLPPLDLGDHYTNTDWTFADDTDVVDFWQHYVTARQKYRGAYDLGQLMDTRERRRIVGDVMISPMDIILGRTWPDTINQALSNFDTHGFTVHSIFFAMPPDRKDVTAYVPLRALLPRGLDGLLVTGLGASAHRDAMPIIRMQADVQNQGYACGYAAASVAASAATIRGVDMKRVQEHLAEIKALPREALTAQDPFPLSREKIAQAVAELVRPEPGMAAEVDSVIQNRRALAVLFAQPQEALPLLEAAHAAAVGTHRLTYAVVLGLMGRSSAAETLLPRIRNARAFDPGWNYTGMGQFGRSASELDAYLIALGRTRDPRALGAILEMVRLLDGTKEFSHHRACAMALESLADPRAAAPLAEVLGKPGMRGHAFTTIEAARAGTGPSRTETKPRNDSLRELILARALFRCGDHEGLGRKILGEYAQDLRGHYARHARAVLEERPNK